MRQFNENDKIFIIALIIFCIFIMFTILVKKGAGEEYPDCKIEVVSFLEYPTYYFLADADKDIMVDIFSLAATGKDGDRTEMIIAPGSWLFALSDGEDLLDYDIIIVLEGMCAIGKDETEFSVYDCKDPITLEMYTPGEPM